MNKGNGARPPVINIGAGRAAITVECIGGVRAKIIMNVGLVLRVGQNRAAIKVFSHFRFV